MHMKDSMICVTSVWNGQESFKVIPLVENCPYVEMIYDPEASMLVIISKIINKNFIVYNQIYNLVSNNIKLKDIIEELKGIKKNLLIKFVNTKLINQHSYFVSNKKIKRYGFKFTGNLKKHVARTVQLFI